MATVYSNKYILLINLLILLLCVEINSKILINNTTDTKDTKDTTMIVTKSSDILPKSQEIRDTNTAVDRIGTFFRGIVHRWIPSWIIDNLPPSLSNYIRGRCIGAMKRIQHTFIPLFFKLGVMSTTLTVLTVMTLKGLLIGLLLLFFNVSNFLAKIHHYGGASKYHHDHHGHYHTSPIIVPSSSWSTPYHSGGWIAPPQPIIKNIHVHVHPPLHGEHHGVDEHLLDHYSASYPNYIQRHDDLTKLLKAYRETPSAINLATSDTLNGDTMASSVNGLSMEDRKYIDKIISKLST